MSKVMKQIVFMSGASTITYSEEGRDESVGRRSVAFVLCRAVPVSEDHPLWNEMAKRTLDALNDEARELAIARGLRSADATRWVDPSELRDMGKWNIHDYPERGLW